MLGSPTGGAAAILLVAFLGMAILGPPLLGDTAGHINPAHAYEGGSSHAWLGTDALGRDILARSVVATRLSLELALLATAIGLLLGTPLGAAAGMLGPRGRGVASRAIQLALAVPGVLVALVLVTIIGPGAIGGTVAFGIALAPVFARTTQTQAASILNAEYVSAARALGVGRRRLLMKYVLPNTAEPLVVQTGVVASVALISISALSFLGVGVQPPTYDWGRMLNDGVEALYTVPAGALVPGITITLAGLMFAFVGESLARGLNPALRLESGSGRKRRWFAPARCRFAGRVERAPALVSPGVGDALVAVEDLRVAFTRDGRQLEAVAGVSFEIRPGEMVGVVGESGSGKSLTALALAGLVPPAGQVSAGRLEFNGTDLRALSTRERRRLLATSLAVIFQDPMSSLNPVLRVGRQLTEKVEVHLGMGRLDALALAEERLTQTRIPDPAMRLRQFPHEYSGGMRQRAMIAMGLMTAPALIVADEPTTALDVTVQAQILDLLRELNERSGTAVLLISHDLAVIGALCSRVIVMYAGRIVETLDVDQLESPAHPYTRALLGTMIDLDVDPEHPLTTIPGQPPPLGHVTSGCPFASRCPEAMERCRQEDPPLLSLSDPDHRVACWARIANGSIAEVERG